MQVDLDGSGNVNVMLLCYQRLTDFCRDCRMVGHLVREYTDFGRVENPAKVSQDYGVSSGASSIFRASQVILHGQGRVDPPALVAPNASTDTSEGIRRGKEAVMHMELIPSQDSELIAVIA
ncbi:hypothetical protein ACOSQ4_030898 [Xanthoceras sorbifolium]